MLAPWRDAFSIRLGGEVQALRWLVARAGIYYESSATTANWTDISSPDADKIGLATGLSILLGRFSLDCAYEHIFPREVTTSYSHATLINVIPNGPTGGPVGNGVYRFHFDVVHLGLRIQLPD